LLVTHGGCGTVMAGLQYGNPMLCLPNGGDQPLIGARLERFGLGRTMDQHSSAEEFAATLDSMIHDTELRDSVRVMANRLKTHAGVDDALAIINAAVPESGCGSLRGSGDRRRSRARPGPLTDCATFRTPAEAYMRNTGATSGVRLCSGSSFWLQATSFARWSSPYIWRLRDAGPGSQPKTEVVPGHRCSQQRTIHPASRRGCRSTQQNWRRFDTSSVSQPHSEHGAK
jgi:hypothetical protein